MMPDAATKAIFDEAEAEAARSNDPDVRPEHLLWSLLRSKNGLAAGILAGLGVDRARLLGDLRKAIGSSGTRVVIRKAPPWSLAARSIVEKAAKAAALLEQGSIRPEHILVALAGAPGTVPQRLLREAGVDYLRIRDAAVNAWNRIAREEPPSILA